MADNLGEARRDELLAALTEKRLEVEVKRRDAKVRATRWPSR